MSDHLQVLGVAAQPLVAQVVDLLLARDVPEVVGVGHDVRGDGLIIETHAAIATTASRARGRASPEVTWGCLVVDVVAGVFDAAPGIDLGDDLVPSILVHGKHIARKSAR